MKKYHFAVILLSLLGCSQQQSAESVHNHNQNNTIQTADRIGSNQVHPADLTSRNKQQEALPEKFLLDVPLIKQNPELKYGCEVTSLAMVLQYAGVTTNKMELYSRIKKDLDPIIRSQTGDIIRWGNPQDGFVGDMTGSTDGYAVYDKPLEILVNDFLPGRAVNLTNQEFDLILNQVRNGYPVVVWTTGDYRLPDRPESWLHGNITIETPLDLHAVVLVGFDGQFVYINDPLSGKKQVPVNKEQFITSWEALKCRAISYN